jgi:tetratricopeptide (TPR) repeat protein
MKSFIILLLLVVVIPQVKAQEIEILYQTKDFKELVKYAEKADELTPTDLYYVGYAFFQLEDDLNAIKMYDKAIEKGLDEDYIYLYKGLALRYSNQNKAAMKNFRLAVQKDSTSQINRTELANSYYFKKDYDNALIHFYKARELDYELGDPYLKIPNIFHIKEEFKKALKEYRLSADLINKEDPVYIELLKEIGVLEYALFENFEEAIITYEKVISATPKNYDLYPKLIKCYYGNEEFEKGDSLIHILSQKFKQNNLSESFQKYGTVPIAEFNWKDRRVLVYKYFEAPKETLDMIYKAYLLSEDGTTIERTLMTEQTIQFKEDSPKHLLCEKESNGTHHTYPYGWSTDSISYKDFKKAVIGVLDDKISGGASSYLYPADKKNKKKKRKKDKK